jgi:UPF0271 protein
MASDAATAGAVLDALAEFGDLTLLAQAGSAALDAAMARGVPVAGEAFADRAYAVDGSLVPRTLPGAVIHDPDEAARRAVRLATEGTVAAIDGSTLTLDARSICVHGDTPGAAALAGTVRAALDAAGVAVEPFIR